LSICRAEADDGFVAFGLSEELLEREAIGSLARGANDYWSTEKRQDHKRKCEEKGGCKDEPMTGETLQEHQAASEGGGGCKVGRMDWENPARAPGRQQGGGVAKPAS